MENDLISRQKLIDDLEAWRKRLDRRVSRFDDMVIHALPAVFDLVNEQETVEAEPKWISVKERLPEKNGYYLCWVETSLMGERKKYEHRKLYWEENVWLFSARVFRTEHPLYWMPLPEPPKEEHHAD